MKGYIQVYTGNGKGKTTAAIGLAIRAAGAGMKVLFAQFVKGVEYSEIKSMRKFADVITVKQYGRENFIIDKPGEEDIRCAVRGLEEVKRLITSGKYDMVILDEANIAVHLSLFSARDLIDVMDAKPDNMELVITGRCADSKVIDRADLVTEMVEVKHYYQNGVQSRPGIEK
ncbi:MAG: cob(I)yrinic acid a,c-diamide adenosyltransferase [Candidatus Latescibacteria bacterium]|jgi:cob(I)alamin adenosyltransferase|nr:cob(I)yrinic acid a,c-diamide adenosyltransferase [Candidatus Latescibacterota bacterium]